MSLIVEDGSGLTNAESFASVAFANAYFQARNLDDALWLDLDTPVKEAKLRDATAWMEQKYFGAWRGQRMTYTQALEWPRAYVPRTHEAALTSSTSDFYWPDDEVPTLVANACCELALRATTAPLSADVGRMAKRERMGPIEVEYEQGTRQTTAYTAVNDMLRRFLQPQTGGVMVRLVRV